VHLLLFSKIGVSGYLRFLEKLGFLNFAFLSLPKKKKIRLDLQKGEFLLYTKKPFYIVSHYI